MNSNWCVNIDANKSKHDKKIPLSVVNLKKAKNSFSDLYVESNINNQIIKKRNNAMTCYYTCSDINGNISNRNAQTNLCENCDYLKLHTFFNINSTGGGSSFANSSVFKEAANISAMSINEEKGKREAFFFPEGKISERKREGVVLVPTAQLDEQTIYSPLFSSTCKSKASTKFFSGNSSCCTVADSISPCLYDSFNSEVKDLNESMSKHFYINGNVHSDSNKDHLCNKIICDLEKYDGLSTKNSNLIVTCDMSGSYFCNELSSDYPLRDKHSMDSMCEKKKVFSFCNSNEIAGTTDKNVDIHGKKEIFKSLNGIANNFYDGSVMKSNAVLDRHMVCNEDKSSSDHSSARMKSKHVCFEGKMKHNYGNTSSTVIKTTNHSNHGINPKHDSVRTCNSLSANQEKKIEINAAILANNKNEESYSVPSTAIKMSDLEIEHTSDSTLSLLDFPALKKNDKVDLLPHYLCSLFHSCIECNKDEKPRINCDQKAEEKIHSHECRVLNDHGCFFSNKESIYSNSFDDKSNSNNNNNNNNNGDSRDVNCGYYYDSYNSSAFFSSNLNASALNNSDHGEKQQDKGNGRMNSGLIDSIIEGNYQNLNYNCTSSSKDVFNAIHTGNASNKQNPHQTEAETENIVNTSALNSFGFSLDNCWSRAMSSSSSSSSSSSYVARMTNGIEKWNGVADDKFNKTEFNVNSSENGDDVFLVSKKEETPKMENKAERNKENMCINNGFDHLVKSYNDNNLNIDIDNSFVATLEIADKNPLQKGSLLRKIGEDMNTYYMFPKDTAAHDKKKNNSCATLRDASLNIICNHIFSCSNCYNFYKNYSMLDNNNNNDNNQYSNKANNLSKLCHLVMTNITNTANDKIMNQGDNLSNSNESANVNSCNTFIKDEKTIASNMLKDFSFTSSMCLSSTHCSSSLTKSCSYFHNLTDQGGKGRAASVQNKFSCICQNNNILNSNPNNNMCNSQFNDNNLEENFNMSTVNNFFGDNNAVRNTCAKFNATIDCFKHDNNSNVNGDCINMQLYNNTNNVNDIYIESNIHDISNVIKANNCNFNHNVDNNEYYLKQNFENKINIDDINNKDNYMRSNTFYENSNADAIKCYNSSVLNHDNLNNLISNNNYNCEEQASHSLNSFSLLESISPDIITKASCNNLLQFNELYNDLMISSKSDNEMLVTNDKNNNNQISSKINNVSDKNNHKSNACDKLFQLNNNDRNYDMNIVNYINSIYDNNFNKSDVNNSSFNVNDKVFDFLVHKMLNNSNAPKVRNNESLINLLTPAAKNMIVEVNNNDVTEEVASSECVRSNDNSFNGSNNMQRVINAKNVNLPFNENNSAMSISNNPDLSLSLSSSSITSSSSSSRIMIDAATIKNVVESGLNKSPSCKRVQFFKTKVCHWFIKGRCFLGDECNYAHSQVDLKNKPDLSNTRLCDDMLKYGMCNKSDCKYAHNVNDLRATHAFYKTRICKYWSVGICPSKDECRHAHGLHELRKPLV